MFQWFVGGSGFHLTFGLITLVKWNELLSPKWSEIRIPNLLVTFIDRLLIPVVRLVTPPGLFRFYAVLCHSQFQDHRCRFPLHVVGLSGCGACPLHCTHITCEKLFCLTFPLHCVVHTIVPPPVSVSPIHSSSRLMNFSSYTLVECIRCRKSETRRPNNSRARGRCRIRCCNSQNQGKPGSFLSLWLHFGFDSAEKVPHADL